MGPLRLTTPSHLSLYAGSTRPRHTSANQTTTTALPRPLADEVRIGKETANPFGSDEDSVMTAWYHVPCMFQAQRRARKNIIEGASDMEGWLRPHRKSWSFVPVCLLIPPTLYTSSCRLC